MKAISILGSTGSVGVTTLDVVGRFPRSLSRGRDGGGRNLDLLVEQVERFRPELVSVATPELARELSDASRCASKSTFVHGREGAIAVATHPEAKLVMSALVGAIGLASDAGRDQGRQGHRVRQQGSAGDRRRGDDARGARAAACDCCRSTASTTRFSNASKDAARESLKRIILTASGGPFRELPADQFRDRSPSPRRSSIRPGGWAARSRSIPRP